MKKLIIILIVFWFSTISVFGVTKEDLENSVIESCIENTSSDDISGRNYCIMAELYGLKQVIRIVREIKTQEEKDKLNQLFKEYTINSKKQPWQALTWDYIKIEHFYRKWHEQWEKSLEHR